jgi:two-component system LytT family response regulator
MIIRTIIVDDEISAVNTLKGMLSQYCPNVQVLGNAFSVGEALELIRKKMPDLVFLDIEMPPFGNAFDILKKIKDHDFGIIFTTAYPHYAVEAINKVQPWSYLIKPYSVQSLKAAVDIALEKLQDQAAAQEAPQYNGLLLQDSRKATMVARFHEILCCKADGSTVEIYLWRNGALERILMYRTLRELESELPTDQFFRTHHGYIVNLGHIHRVERTGRNALIHLNHQLTAHVSVQRMTEFDQKLEQFLKKK